MSKKWKPGAVVINPLAPLNHSHPHLHPHGSVFMLCALLFPALISLLASMPANGRWCFYHETLLTSCRIYHLTRSITIVDECNFDSYFSYEDDLWSLHQSWRFGGPFSLFLYVILLFFTAEVRWRRRASVYRTPWCPCRGFRGPLKRCARGDFWVMRWCGWFFWHPFSGATFTRLSLHLVKLLSDTTSLYFAFCLEERASYSEREGDVLEMDWGIVRLSHRVYRVCSGRRRKV